MKTITRYIAVILILSMMFGIAGCSAKVRISHKRACEAFDKFGAEKLDDAQDLVRKVANLHIYGGSYYYTTDDEDEAIFIVENIIVHADQHPDGDYQACTYFSYQSEDSETLAIIFVITFGDEKNAAEWFNKKSSNLQNSNEYNCNSGSTSGIEYAFFTKDDVPIMTGFYKQGNTVLEIHAAAPETSGLKPYEGIIKDMGLISPLGAEQTDT